MGYATTATILLILLAAPLAADDATEVLYIGRLDRDADSDTVLGGPTGDLRMLATAIHWGTPYSSTGGPAPTATGRTRLLYPAWTGLEGSFAVEDVDRDGVDDLLIFFNAAAPHARDSARALALLGQDALHDQAEIALAEIARPVQRAPFVAADLDAVGVLVEPAVRELSGRPSYRWGELRLRAGDTVAQGPPPATLAEWMALYPNPASVAATLEARRLGPGDYTVELVDIDGTIHYERRLVLEREQALSSTLDLSDEPPGLYLVRVRRGTELVASYPVVVVR